MVTFSAWAAWARARLTADSAEVSAEVPAADKDLVLEVVRGEAVLVAEDPVAAEAAAAVVVEEAADEAEIRTAGVVLIMANSRTSAIGAGHSRPIPARFLSRCKTRL